MTTSVYIEKNPIKKYIGLFWFIVSNVEDTNTYRYNYIYTTIFAFGSNILLIYSPNEHESYWGVMHVCCHLYWKVKA